MKMSEAGHMDVSPARTNSETRKSVSPKGTTPELSREFVESIHNDPAEQKHHMSSENVQNELAEPCTAVSNCIVVEQLGPSPDDVTQHSLSEHMGPSPDDVIENSLTEHMGLPADDVTKNSLFEHMGSPPDDATKNSPFEHMGSPPDDVTKNSLLEFMGSSPGDAIKNSTNEELGSPPTDVTKYSSTEQLGPPPECATKNSNIEQLGSPLKDATKNSTNEELGSPPEDFTKYSSTEQRGPPPECATKNSSTQEMGLSLKDATKSSTPEHFEPPCKDEIKNSRHSGYNDRRTNAKFLKRKYTLRSSDRVLRTRSQEKPKAPEPSNNPVNVSAGEGKKRKNKKTVKNLSADEFSRIRTHLRYLLNRMSYERSLIDAYSGEGWKGQSLEKLKPEKELQRATSEIFRRKLKIRDLFQRLDSLCAEGRLPESLFDSEGQICSEDIFCAKCGSKDFCADNDIILCDGACERGFHQFCLEPPLLKEEIPPDDEGWLCPGCDCKVDCIGFLNDSQGTILSISDSWEKVFPEAAAAGGNMQDDNFGLPSDDSEDNDYDPEGPEVEGKVQGDESSSDESDFTSASDDLEAPPNDEQLLGLPSDDSEDDDYDPNAPDLEDQIKEESSSSDFTSDSEDFGMAFDDNMFSDRDEGPVRSGLGDKKKQSLNDELLSISELDQGRADSAPMSGKRRVERLDYKTLYDETYRNAPSDSSDDEEWTDTVAPRKRKNNTGKVAPASSSGNTPITMKGKNIKEVAHNLKETEHTPKRTCQKLSSEGTNNSPAKSHKGSEPHSSGKRAKSSTHRRLGEAVTQRLYKSFKENQYPDRATKENLAKELGITSQQVDKWFGNARWSSRHSSSMKASGAKGALNKDIPSPQKNEMPNPEPGIKAKDAACNGVDCKESPKAGAAVNEFCSGDVRERKAATEESSEQKSATSNSRKRKNELVLSSEETPKRQAGLPVAQGVKTSGRIQTRSRKSVV